MAAGSTETSLETLERQFPPNTETAPKSEGSIRRVQWDYRNLTDYISQMVWVVTPQGQGAYFNPYWRNYTGLSEEQSLDFGWMPAFHCEDVDSFMRLLGRTIGPGGWELEARLRRASDGSYRRHLCRCSILANQSDRPICLLICCTDIEEWRNTEAAANKRGALLALALRTHDQEKRKIARSLHDSAGQYLVALQVKLDGLQTGPIGNPSSKNPIVDECRELVKRCSKELRAISYLLYPPLLDDLGLESAIRFHVDGFMERNNISVDLEIEPNLGRLDRDLEIALFRVVQEALASMHRQPAGKNAHISVGASETSVFVEVKGSGGTDPLCDSLAATSHTVSGLAVATVRQRILEAGGRFEIESQPSGMVIRAAVPRKALVAQACG